MKRRWILWLSLALVLFLAACSQDTRIQFRNKTECGTATITITNSQTGNLREYTLDEDKSVNVSVDPGVTYRYEVKYAGRPGSALKCETKSAVITIQERGQSANISLASATATPTGN